MSKSTIIVSATCVATAAVLYAAGCVGVSRAETPTPDAPATQEYTAPDTRVVITRDMPTATDAPVVQTPDTTPTVTPDPGSATAIRVPDTTRNAINATAPDYTLIPCPVEDYAGNCYWDAATMGNGQGQSFIHFNGVYYYGE